MVVFRRALATLGLLFAIIATAVAQQPQGQVVVPLPTPGCPTGVATSAICGQPIAVNIQLSDLVSTFQYGETPDHTRAATWNQVFGMLGNLPTTTFNSNAYAITIPSTGQAPQLMPLSGFANLFSIPNNYLLANTSGATGPAVGTSLNALMGNVLGDARGSLAEYGAGGWTALAPGTSGYVLTSNGTTADPSWMPITIPSNIVTGPGSSTATDLACWNNSTGTLLSDCGPPPVLYTLPNAVLVNNSSSQQTGVAFGAANTCLVGQGTTSLPTFTSCPTSGSGTVNTGSAGQGAFYVTTGNAVSGTNDVIASSGTLTLESNIKLSSTYLNSNVKVGINIGLGGTPGAWLDLLGPDASSSTLGLRIRNSNGTVMLQTNDAGGIIAYGPLNLGSTGSENGTIILAGSTSGSATLTVPAAAGSTTLQLPATDGTNGQFLQTNGGGVTTWANPTGSGTVNTGSANQVPYYAAAGTTLSPAPDVVLSAGSLTLGVAGTAAGSLTLAGSSSGTGIISVPATAGSGTVFQLPATVGTAGTFLEALGNGATGWVTPPGGGNVVGPSSSTSGDLSCFNNTTGTLIKDCGPAPTPFTGTNEVLAVNGSSTEVGLPYGSAGQVLLGNGTTTAPSFGNLAVTNLTGLPTGANQVLAGNGSTTGTYTLTAGANVTITQTTGAITIASTGGGGSSPAGASGTVQYNNAGSLGGAAGLTVVPGITCNGTSDVAAAVNTAISTVNAAGGGVVLLPSGTCEVISTSIVPMTGVILKGAGIGNTILQAGSSLPVADPVVESYDYASLVGTNTAGGVYNFGLEDMTIDANKANRSGATNAVEYYGFHGIFRNLLVENSAAEGIRSEWATSAAVPVGSSGVGMEDHLYNVSAASNGTIGIEWTGPHDSVFVDTHVYLNGTGMELDDTSHSSATNTRLIGIHSYGNSGIGIVIDAPIMATDIQSESNTGDGLDVISTSGDAELTADRLFTWNNTGMGLNIQFAGTGSNITNFLSTGNAQYGLSVATGYNVPPTTITGFNISHNTYSGVYTCALGASGGSELIMSSGTIESNGGDGINNCMQELHLSNVVIASNSLYGINTSAASNNTLDTWTGLEVESNTSGNINFGTSAGTNNIQAVVYTSASGQACQSGTFLTSDNVSITCGGSGTNNSISSIAGSALIGGVVNPIPTISSVTTVGATTLTAAQMIGGYISRGGAQTGGFTDTTDTAANIIAAIPGYKVGTSFNLHIYNGSSGGYPETIAAGTGVTLANGSSFAIPETSYQNFVCAITSSTTVTCYANGSGTN